MRIEAGKYYETRDGKFIVGPMMWNTNGRRSAEKGEPAFGSIEYPWYGDYRDARMRPWQRDYGIYTPDGFVFRQPEWQPQDGDLVIEVYPSHLWTGREKINYSFPPVSP